MMFIIDSVPVTITLDVDPWLVFAIIGTVLVWRGLHALEIVVRGY